MAPKKIKLGLREKYFDLLTEGKKIADGRLFKQKNGTIYKNKYENLKPGDILEYYKDLPNGTRTENKFSVKVKDFKIYDSVEDMLSDLKLKNILPGIKTKKQGLELYEDIYGNKLKDGVLIGFTLEPTEENIINIKDNRVEKNNKKSKYEEKNKEIIEITNKSNKPQKHEIYIKEPWMTLIREGLKEVEGRLYKGMVESFRLGDTLIFNHKTREGKDEKLKVEITKLTKYPDFRSLLYHEGKHRVLPGFPNIRTGNELYESIYNPKSIRQYGALAISFKILGKNNVNTEIRNVLKKDNKVEPNVKLQKEVNINQNIVHNQQVEINNNLKNNNVVKKNEKLLESNSEMLNENSNILENANNNNVDTAVVTSNQIAVNLNQKNVIKNQEELISQDDVEENKEEVSQNNVSKNQEILDNSDKKKKSKKKSN